MAIEITHVRFEGSSKTHEAIARYQWKSVTDGELKSSDKPTLVDWIDNKNGDVYVGSGSNRVAVGSVHPTDGRRPYLQTYADGKWSNNLLSLPTF
jgi:hypothetical protein